MLLQQSTVSSKMGKATVQGAWTSYQEVEDPLADVLGILAAGSPPLEMPGQVSLEGPQTKGDTACSVQACT